MAYLIGPAGMSAMCWGAQVSGTLLSFGLLEESSLFPLGLEDEAVVEEEKDGEDEADERDGVPEERVVVLHGRPGYLDRSDKRRVTLTTARSALATVSEGKLGSVSRPAVLLDKAAGAAVRARIAVSQSRRYMD